MKNIFVFMISLAFVTSVTAQESFQKELFPVDAVMKYRSEIGLSAQQVERVKKIYDDHITAFNSLKWDLDAELVSLNKLLAQPHVDEKLSTAQMEKTMKLEDELKRMKLSMLIKVKNELKQAQQEQLKKLRAENGMDEATEITSVNENPRIVIRAASSYTANPIYIIKSRSGERRTSSINDIPPSQIKSIEVIKGESATKQYGEDGKNGVIILTLNE